MPKVSKDRTTASRVDPIARRVQKHGEEYGCPGDFTDSEHEDELTEHPYLDDLGYSGEGDSECEGSSNSEGSDEDEVADNSGLGADSAAARPSLDTLLRNVFARADQETVGYLMLATMKRRDEPRPTRVIRVPSTATFHQLHLIVQTAFRWRSPGASYQFGLHTIHRPGDGQRMQHDAYGEYHDTSQIMQLNERAKTLDDRATKRELNLLKSSRGMRLWQIFENSEWVRKGIEVRYVFSDWRHTVHFMGHADPTLGAAMGPKLGDAAAFCVSGYGAPEPTYQMDDYDEIEKWEWDIEEVNKEMKKLCRLKMFKD